MSLRSAIVDGLIANVGINALISGRCYDRFFEFEDFLNQRPNSSKFPVITVESATSENEQNQDGHDNINLSNLDITCYTQVHLGNMKSRSVSARNKQKTIIRSLDTLSDLVVSYLNSLSGTLSSYYIRNSHVDNGAQDGVFETEGNRQIISTQISLEIIYT
jgi:hypothetical protein